MLLRTALFPLLAFAVCQIGYGQSETAGAAPTDANPRALQPAVPAAAPTAGGPQTNNGAPSTNHGMLEMNYGMDTLPEDSFPADTECGDGGCAPCRTTYVPWWHRCFVWSYWRVHGLPSPWCTPGNLSGHIPCNPCMGTYYYFRPYNWFHIPDQQQEAANYSGDPRNPCDNRVVFDGLYDGLE